MFSLKTVLPTSMLEVVLKKRLLLHVHLEVGAVGGQVGVEPDPTAGARVATIVGDTDKDNFGLLVLYQGVQIERVRAFNTAGGITCSKYRL